MDDLGRQARPAQTAAPAAASAEAAGEFAPSAEDLDAVRILQLARLAHTHAAPTASQQAFGGRTSHDGGFTGFGAEFQPFSYTDPHVNHSKLDPEARALGAQHVRMFVPIEAVMSGMLGKAGPDHMKDNVDRLEKQVQKDPSNAELQKELAGAKKSYADAVRFTDSFTKTLLLAGKHTTINLTFCGGASHPGLVDQYSLVVRYLIGQGYDHLQLTLENEPNGPDSGNGFRGTFDKGVKDHNRAEEDAGAKQYVAEYQRLDQDLRDPNEGSVRDQVKVVGGDMVGNNRDEFWRTITRLGLNKYVDAYSFHIYWGANKDLAKTLLDLQHDQALGAQIAKGKTLQVTEFGKERFATPEERAKDPSKGIYAVETGVGPAFEQGIFALSAINDGFAGVVKWDAFDGDYHDGKLQSDASTFHLIGGPESKYATDASYRLLQMFTHATEPGWRATGTNHGAGGSEVHFRSADGKDGAILAMQAQGGTLSTAGLPAGEKIRVAIWNQDGKGGLSHEVLAPGAHSIHIPVGGAVAVSTKPLG
jgi:hypothetical protein